MEDNFFQLSKYSIVDEIDNINLMDVLDELDYYINHPNNSCYDIINYERLFYIKKRFGNEQQVMDKIKILENIISNNYEAKLRVYARYSLKNWINKK